MLSLELFIVLYYLYKTFRVELNDGEDEKMSDKEIKFIWTILIVWVGYLMCSAPLAIVCNVLGIVRDKPFLIVIGDTTK